MILWTTSFKDTFGIPHLHFESIVLFLFVYFLLQLSKKGFRTTER